MAINQTVWQCDLRNNIADDPTKMRHRGRLFTVGLQTTAQLSQVMDGALLDDAALTIVAIRADFGKALPENRDQVEIQLSNGKWQMFEISNTPDRYDPSSPQLTIILGSTNK